MNMVCYLSSFFVSDDIEPLVYLGNKVIDDFHHFSRVFAQIESLLETRADIPLKLFQRIIFTLLRLVDHVEKEVEFEAAFVCLRSNDLWFQILGPYIFWHVFQHFKLHDLKVKLFGLLLRVSNLDGSRRKGLESERCQLIDPPFNAGCANLVLHFLLETEWSFELIERFMILHMPHLRKYIVLFSIFSSSPLLIKISGILGSLQDSR